MVSRRYAIQIHSLTYLHLADNLFNDWTACGARFYFSAAVALSPNSHADRAVFSSAEGTAYFRKKVPHTYSNAIRTFCLLTYLI